MNYYVRCICIVFLHCFSVASSQQLTDNDTVTVPSVTLPSESQAPTTTTIETTTTSICNICGETNTEVVSSSFFNPIVLDDEVTTCFFAETKGRLGELPNCEEARTASEEACICQESTSNLYDTCYICGGEDMEVSLDRTLTTVLLVASATNSSSTQPTTCFGAEVDGLAGRISNCSSAQTAAFELCDCQRSTTTRPPVAAVTSAPTASEFPTSSPYPTYSEKCSVCPNPDQVVTNPEDLTVFSGFVVECGRLEREASAGKFLGGTEDCEALKEASASCRCEAPQPPTDEPAMQPSLPICSVCFSRMDNQPLRVGNPNAVVEYDGVSISCSEIEERGLGGRIPADLCFRSQAVAAISCGCIPQSDSPSTIPSSSPTTSPKPSMTRTISPTTSNSPTTTAYPTHAEKCYLCGEGNEVSRPENIMTVYGTFVDCGRAEYEGMRGVLVSPSECSDFQDAALGVCGCRAIEGYTRAPSKALTFSPTVTPLPTLTAPPSYGDLCSLCENEDDVLGNETATVVVGGVVLTCDMLQMEVTTGRLPPLLCPEAAGAVSKCGCQSRYGTNQPSTAMPSLTPSEGQATVEPSSGTHTMFSQCLWLSWSLNVFISSLLALRKIHF